MFSYTGDTMTVLNADDLDKNAILWATVAYTVANLDDILPREGEAIIEDTTSASTGPTEAACSMSSQSWLLLVVAALLGFIVKKLTN